MTVQGVCHPLWLRGGIVHCGVMGLAGFVAPVLDTILRIQGH